jgi:hypothetical protein
MFGDLIPELQQPARELVDAAARSGLQPRVTSTRRSSTQQARLYRRFLAGASPLPAAPPGTSAHEFGYAFDMVCSPWESLWDVGYTWESWGGIWGRDQDPVHFQYPGFVPPQAMDNIGRGENVVQRAARTFSDLPWYLSIFAPLALATEAAPTEAELQRRQRLACKLFGLGC